MHDFGSLRSKIIGQIGQEVARRCGLYQRLSRLTLKQNRRHGARFGVLPAESSRKSENFVSTWSAIPLVLPYAGPVLANLLGWIGEIVRDSPALQASSSDRLWSSSA